MKGLRLYCIGMMGGMFDPVHLGHLNTAARLKVVLGLDQVRLVPCGNPVHRQAGLATAQQRCEMLELAVAGYEGLILDRRECERAGPSWTYLTLASLRAEFPEASISVMMGLDAFISLPTWYRWQELFDLGHLVVSARPTVELDQSILPPEMREMIALRQVTSPERLQTTSAGCLYMAEIATPAISSTRVRAAIAEEQTLSGLLPESVIDYINQQQLYR